MTDPVEALGNALGLPGFIKRMNAALDNVNKILDAREARRLHAEAERYSREIEDSGKMVLDNLPLFEQPPRGGGR